MSSTIVNILRKIDKQLYVGTINPRGAGDKNVILLNTGIDQITITDHMPIIFSYNENKFLTWNVTYDDSNHMVYKDKLLKKIDERKLTNDERLKIIQLKIDILQKIIEDYEIDILCLQECTEKMKDAINTKFNSNFVMITDRNKIESEWGMTESQYVTMIFKKKLSEVSDIIYDLRYQILSLIYDDKRLYLMNIHDGRNEGYETSTVKNIKKYNYDFIVDVICGDFNLYKIEFTRIFDNDQNYEQLKPSEFLDFKDVLYDLDYVLINKYYKQKSQNGGKYEYLYNKYRTKYLKLKEYAKNNGLI